MRAAARRAQLEGLFLSELLLQIRKVNDFYCDRAAQMAERLEQLAPLITSSALHGALRSANRLSTSPREALNLLAQSPLVSQDTQQAVTRFVALADEVCDLRLQPASATPSPHV